MHNVSIRILFLCCLAGSCASGAVAPETGLEQATSQSRELATTAAYFLPSFDQADGPCEVTCNTEEVDIASVSSTGEPRTCVGTLKVFCTGNSTSGLSVAGLKCEGKSTLFEGTAICEGSLRNFVKKGFKTPEGKFIKSTKAYGCLGTSIGFAFNGTSSSVHAVGFKPADTLAVEAALAGEKRSVEGRCDGLSVQFQAAKVGGNCNHGKRPSKDSKHADRQLDPAADQPESAEGMDPSFEFPQADVAFIQLPGARRSLASHHDKHDKHNKKHSDKGKHHEDRHDNDEEDDKSVEDSHNKHHADNGLEHSDKHAHGKHSPMTFEDAEGKIQHLMQKSGVEWLPHELPSGSGQIEGPHGPDCKITCNGRPTWFGAFFPCFGELKVDCEGGSRSLPNHIAGSDLDTTKGTDHGFEFHGACQGFWSGALFKSCQGFSTAHVEARDKEVWDFCSGKKAVRMGARSGKGFFSASVCRGKDLVVVEKDKE